MQLGANHWSEEPLKSERKWSGTKAVVTTTEQTFTSRNSNISKNFFHIVSTLKEERKIGTCHLLDILNHCRIVIFQFWNDGKAFYSFKASEFMWCLWKSTKVWTFFMLSSKRKETNCICLGLIHRYWKLSDWEGSELNHWILSISRVFLFKILD